MSSRFAVLEWTARAAMMSSVSLYLLFFCLVSLPSAQLQAGARRKFEYKLSFKGPHLVQRDGTIPFWDHYGHAIASDESVRITPSLKSKKGAVWSKEKNTHPDWEVEVVFRVSGRGRIGADGLAVWYTTERGEEGPVFGSKDNWNGLGVFFDSFDNDGLRNNPYILAMVNDGSMTYNHESDGSNQQLGGCLKDFRNKPFPVRARIEYYKKALTVSIHNGLTNNRDEFELCLRAENVELPTEGYFGVSAATGGLADDHDALAFLTSSLISPSSDKPQSGSEGVPDDEKQKFEKEFNEYRQKLEQAKEDYKRDHPDKPGEYIEDDEKLFEAQEIRELKMILDGQNEIHRSLKLLVSKLDEVVGRQERELSLLTLISQQPHAPGGGPVVGQVQGSHAIGRNDVDTMLNGQKELVGHVRELKTLVGDVQGKVQGGGAASSNDGAKQLQDVKSSISGIQNDLRVLLSKTVAPPTAAVNCPSVPEISCVSTFYLFTFLVAQLLCFIGYMTYRSTREAAAKKFY